MRSKILGASAFISLFLFTGFASAASFTVLSHRGLYQNYSREGLTPETCTAEIILPPTHDYLENTIPSMNKAFELGADMVELDVHSTVDGKIVVFHDWTLECRTNGRGVTQEQTFAYLRGLDIGYNYTADKHLTHPFRCGRGDQACLERHRMPTLAEVVAAFPHKRFVINMKSRASSTLEALVEELRRIEREQKYDLRQLWFYCSDQATNERLGRELPAIYIPKLNMEGVNQCWRQYHSQGSFPAGCRGVDMALPADVMESRGLPAMRRILQDVHAADSRFMAVRVDSAPLLKFVSQLPIDAIWTDEIATIGPLLKKKK